MLPMLLMWRSGCYLVLVKSFTDDLAWKVKRPPYLARFQIATLNCAGYGYGRRLVQSGVPVRAMPTHCCVTPNSTAKPILGTALLSVKTELDDELCIIGNRNRLCRTVACSQVFRFHLLR